MKQSTKHNHYRKSPQKKSRVLLHLWWVALVGGFIYLVIMPHEDTAIVTQDNIKPIVAKPASETKLSDKLSKAVSAEQKSFPLPTNFPTPTEIMPTHTSTTQASTATPPATATPNQVLITHVVKQGEMVLSIALAYDLAVEDVLAANNITDPTLLQIGQELIIPVTATPTPIPPTETPTPKYSPTPTETPVVHIIQPGDTPLSIAIEYEITSEALMRFNRIFNPSGLQIGQELLIPTGRELPEEFAEETETRLHVVRAGDTLLALTYRYGSTVEDIMALNPNIDPTNLQIGEQIEIPLTARPTNSVHFAPTTYSSAPAVTIPAPVSEDILGLQQQMLEAVNAYRTANGYAPYSLDGTLNEIAISRAQDMDARGYFSHYTPEGLRVQDIVRSYDIMDRWVSENIQRNTEPASQTVTEAITWFMNDAPHRYNILHPHYNRIGVGISQARNHHTFVLVFAGN